MKKVLSLLLLALLSVGAWAAEITQNMNNVDLSWTATGDDQTATSQGITYYLAKGGSSTPTSQGLQAAHIRVYKSGSLTISAGSTISKIEVTATGGASYTADGFTVTNGTYADGVWTGSSSSVTLNATEHQVRVSKLVITLDDGTVAPLVASSMVPPK